MRGMLCWFRLFLHRKQPVDDGTAHADGTWRLVLENSPWWDCPAFRDLTHEVDVDEDGVPKRGEDGKILMKSRSPMNEELEFRFLERWWFEVVKLPLRRFRNGDVVVPALYPAWKKETGQIEGEREWWWKFYDEGGKPPDIWGENNNDQAEWKGSEEGEIREIMEDGSEEGETREKKHMEEERKSSEGEIRDNGNVEESITQEGEVNDDENVGEGNVDNMDANDVAIEEEESREGVMNHPGDIEEEGSKEGKIRDDADMEDRGQDEKIRQGDVEDQQGRQISEDGQVEGAHIMSDGSLFGDKDMEEGSQSGEIDGDEDMEDGGVGLMSDGSLFGDR